MTPVKTTKIIGQNVRVTPGGFARKRYTRPMALAKINRIADAWLNKRYAQRVPA
jgi:hypothetical protein